MSRLALLVALCSLACRPVDLGPASGSTSSPSILSASTPTATTPAQDGAAVEVSTLPTSLACGEASEATVGMRNTGTSVWTRADGYKLGAVGDEDPMFGPDVRVWLTDEDVVAPGQSHVFQIPLVAPPTAGTFVTDWQMVREGVQWFGEPVSTEVVVTCEAVPVRTGIVTLDGNSLSDDQGRFNALGATMMWALWAYQNDRPKLEANLDFLSQHGFHYIRALGVVGDPDATDYWDGREISTSWPDYDAAIAGLTDLVYDPYGLRIEWTLIGDGQITVPTLADKYDLVDRFLAMSVGREEAILHFEIANEAWQNGFPGDAGRVELRELSAYLKDRTPVLVAASAPEGPECSYAEAIYNGGIADIATPHFDRDIGTVEGSWRPVRQPWEWEYCVDVPVGSNNEPIGPGSSVASEEDPAKLVAAAITTYVSNLPMYVFHSHAGVRGDSEIYDEPGADAFVHLAAIVPPDLASWGRKNASWSDAPFVVYATEGGVEYADTMWPDLYAPDSGVVRAYGDVSGDAFVVFPIGILNSVKMEARYDMDFDVIDPQTGGVVATHALDAGDAVTLSGAEALLLVGATR